METHIKVLGWLYIILSVLGALLAAFIVTILVVSGAISGDRTAFTILTVVGIAVSAFAILFLIPGVIAGIGLLRMKTWARILAIVLGILNLPSMPFGTALGVYSLVVLFDDDAARLLN